MTPRKKTVLGYPHRPDRINYAYTGEKADTEAGG